MMPGATIIWDAHACFPLRFDADLSDLQRYKQAGIHYTSINVGMDYNSIEEVLRVIANFRYWIAQHASDYILVQSTADISDAVANNKMALSFDLEGSVPLMNDLHMVSCFYNLGVKQMLLAYNADNSAAGGCWGKDNLGLSHFGCELVQEMNRVGMVLDLSHMSVAASFDAIDISTQPVVFSHSNPKSLADHPRNITDEQIEACAKTGGVIGINGIGRFLGNNDTSTQRVVEHIDYVVNLVGDEHVGIGLDYQIDIDELLAYKKAHPEIYPPEDSAVEPRYVAPEQFPEIIVELRARHYSEIAIANIMGENFLRIAKQVWQ